MKLWLIVAVALLLGAGARAVDADTSATTSAVSAPATSIPPRAAIDWAAMSRPERKEYMKTVILPKAQQLFSTFDAKQFKHVTCGTCHGEDYARGTYKMPSADLPMLPASPRGFKELRERSPEIVTFMSTQVKPTMASLLGLPEFSPTNTEGFACFSCHMKGHEKPLKSTPPAP